MSEDLRFPVGKFEKIENIDDNLRSQFLKTIDSLAILRSPFSVNFQIP